MFMDISGIDLFDLNVDMVCAKVRLRSSWISLILLYFIYTVGMVCAKGSTQMLMDIIDIDLFDQNMSMVCAKVRLRCSWISLVLIYLIKNVVLRWI